MSLVSAVSRPETRSAAAVLLALASDTMSVRALIFSWISSFSLVSPSFAPIYNSAKRTRTKSRMINTSDRIPLLRMEFSFFFIRTSGDASGISRS